MEKFIWNENTKYEDMPKWLIRLIPSTVYLDDLDYDNQFAHIRFRVMHEIDITEEEGIDETGMSEKEYQNAVKFMMVTGGRM